MNYGDFKQILADLKKGKIVQISIFFIFILVLFIAYKIFGGGSLDSTSQNGNNNVAATGQGASANQTNFYGPVNLGNQPRQLTYQEKDNILSRLKNLGVSSVVFYFNTDNGETNQYAQQIGIFLRNEGYTIYGLDPTDVRSGAGVPEGQVNIIPISSSTARIQIGPQ